MLVLRRKAEETIVLFWLSRIVSIKILAVEGERVKVGITAPPDIAIVREELLGKGAKGHLDEQESF